MSVNPSEKDTWPSVSKEQLIERAYAITGGNIKDLTTEKLRELMTVTQFLTDVCLNEIEHRGELTFSRDGVLIVPYMSDHMLETILTR